MRPIPHRRRDWRSGDREHDRRPGATSVDAEDDELWLEVQEF